MISTPSPSSESSGTVFAVPFLFPENSDLVVVLVDAAGNSATLVLGTDYTVSGAGNTAGGSVTLSLPLTAGSLLSISRSLDVVQDTDLRNQGKFYQQSIEDAFDYLTMLIQQTFSWLSRALVRPVGKNYYDAQNRNIKSLADDGDDQDAVNVRGLRSYVDSAIAGVVGGFGWFLQSGSGAVQRTFQSKMRETISLDDFGAVGDGTADDLAAVTNALAAASARDMVTSAMNYRVSSRPLNPTGSRVKGPGKLILPVATGLRQLNTYAHDAGIGLMKEHLYKAYQRLSSGSGNLVVQFYGDSTVAGGNGETAPYSLATLITDLMAAKGIPNFVGQNFGVGGTSWVDLNAIPSIDATVANTTDVLVIKYGINDVQDRAALYTTMRTKLAAIRAATNGDVHKLSILVMLPSSTYDLPHNRDARWYEQLRNMYVAVCEEFQCTFFDTYALLQDTSTASGYWQDNPFADGVSGVHMLDVGQNWVWSNLVDFLFGQDEIMRFRKNRYINQGAGSGQPVVGAAATVFPFGESVYRVSSGWPLNGQVRVVRNTDGGAYQEHWGLTAQDKRMWRAWDPVGVAWLPWHGQESTPTLLNGWVAYGSSRKAPVYAREGNLCYLRGTIKSGTTTAATALMTLPVGFRPTGDQVFLCRGSAATVAIGINASGSVFLQTTGDATETCLDGITFVVG